MSSVKLRLKSRRVQERLHEPAASNENDHENLCQGNVSAATDRELLTTGDDHRCPDEVERGLASSVSLPGNATALAVNGVDGAEKILVVRIKAGATIAGSGPGVTTGGGRVRTAVYGTVVTIGNTIADGEKFLTDAWAVVIHIFHSGG